MTQVPRILSIGRPAILAAPSRAKCGFWLPVQRRPLSPFTSAIAHAGPMLAWDCSGHSYSASTDQQNEDEEIVAHQWLTEVFEPVVRTVPRDLKRKLEPAEVFHEVLEHRWFLSEEAGHEIDTMEAARSYVEDVLRAKPDEKLALPTPAIPEAD